MSTKSTMRFATEGDDGVHLYGDCFADETVFLQMSGPGILFEASPSHITLPIPAHVWEFIRTAEADVFRFREAGKTDAELEAIAKSDVAKRVRDLRHGRNFQAGCGFGLYGEPELPEDEQIRKGVEAMKVRRDRIAKLRQRVTDLEAQK